MSATVKKTRPKTITLDPDIVAAFQSIQRAGRPETYVHFTPEQDALIMHPEVGYEVSHKHKFVQMFASLFGFGSSDTIRRRWRKLNGLPAPKRDRRERK